MVKFLAGFLSYNSNNLYITLTETDRSSILHCSNIIKPLTYCVNSLQDSLLYIISCKFRRFETYVRNEFKRHFLKLFKKLSANLTLISFKRFSKKCGNLSIISTFLISKPSNRGYNTHLIIKVNNGVSNKNFGRTLI